MRVLVTGASGQLGAYLIEGLQSRGHEVRGWSGRTTGRRGAVTLVPVDLADPDAVERPWKPFSPRLSCTPRPLLLRARFARTRAGRSGSTSPRPGAWPTGAQRRECRMLYVSTDLVFDGAKAWNREEDAARPIMAYGQTKLAPEPAVTTLTRGLVVRVSLMFGPAPCGRASFFDQAVEALRRGESRRFFEDEFRTPLHYRTAAEILARLLESKATGLVHVGGAERLSRFEMMRRVAVALGIDPGLVLANRQADAVEEEPRPADVSLDTTRSADDLAGLAETDHRGGFMEA